MTPSWFTKRKLVLPLVVMAVAFAAAGALWHSDSASAARPPQRIASGTEFVAVFITAGFCIGNRTEGFPGSIQKMKSQLAARAAAANERFVSVGVSIDWIPESGVQTLTPYGNFDEIIAGRNWMNSAALRYIWNDLPGDPVVPQVIILRRKVQVDPRIITVGDEEVVLRKLGAREIMDWVRTGAPVPTSRT